MHDKSLAKAGGGGWGAAIFAVDRVRSLEIGWWCVGGQRGRILPLSLFLGAFRPTSLVAEVTAIASVLRMLRATPVSSPLTVLSNSECALGVVLSDDRALMELLLLQVARSEARHYRQRGGIEGRHVAAYKGPAKRLRIG